MNKQIILLSIFINTVFGSGYNLFAQENSVNRQKKDIALLFAVEDYQNMKKLNRPIDDALKLKDYLENSYGFTVELIRNPDLKTVKSKLKEYADKYRRNVLDNTGQLLVFFSGHGLPADMTGFFVPVDGDYAPENIYSTCYSYNQMRGQMKRINVAHKLLIVDACYSAYLNPHFDKGVPVFDKPDKLSAFDKEIKIHNENNSFEYITSDASGRTTPDNSQLMKKLFEGFEYSNTRLGFIKLNVLVPSYLISANPQPYYERLGEDIGKTSFMFFKNTENTTNTNDVVIIEEKIPGIIKLDNKIAGNLYIDGKNKGRLNVSVYTLKNISPGVHNLKINEWEQEITVYSGQTINVTTKSSKPIDLSKYLTDSRDGKSYKIVEIGSQVWMAENLAFETASGKWAYNDKQSNVAKYGYLYDLKTAKIVCPSGWHLPTKTEFETLLNNYGGNENHRENYTALIPGGRSGFSALYGGWGYSYGYYNLGEYSNIWSSTLERDGTIWVFGVYYAQSEAYLNALNPAWRFSVRCLKDN